jgi:hypothetical protein
MSNPEIQPMMDAIGFVYSPNKVQKVYAAGDIRIFPNPAVSNFSIRFSTYYRTSVLLEIISTSGRRLLIPVNNKILEPGVHQVEIGQGDLAPGLYLARLVPEEGVPCTVRLIVQ